MNEAQIKDTHGNLDKKCADDESNPFNKCPLDEFGQLCAVQSVDMPAGAICNLVNIGDGS